MSELTDERPRLVLDHSKSPAPIDKALTDLHNNIEDAHQLIADLEIKIAPILGYDDVPTHPAEADGGTPESMHSRIHDVVRDSDSRVQALHDRIRSLIRLVEL